MKNVYRDTRLVLHHCLGADAVQGQAQEALPRDLRCPSVAQYCVSYFHR